VFRYLKRDRKVGTVFQLPFYLQQTSTPHFYVKGDTTYRVNYPNFGGCVLPTAT